MVSSFLSIQAPTSPRFQRYCALFVFSIAALAAAASSALDEKTSELKWVLSMTTISMVFSLLVIVIHFFEGEKVKFVGSVVEGGFAVFFLALWSAGLPVIMNPDHFLAVNDGFEIMDANLYFSSWICFGLIMAIGGSLLQEVTDRNFVTQTAQNTLKWYALMVCSIVVMVSSAKIHKNFSCKNDEFLYDFVKQICKRNKLAISLGVLGTIIGLVLSVLTSKGITTLQELVVSIVTLVFFTFGVGFITFGEGSGTFIGNLYFSTWFSFSLSVSLFIQCARDIGAPPNKDEPNLAVEIVEKDDAHMKMEPEVDEEVPEGPAEVMEMKG